MRRKHAEVDPAEAHAARLAWWAAFLTTVVLVLALSFVHTADAATLPGAQLIPPQLSLLEPEEVEEGEEDEGEVCGVEEDEEGEEEEIGGEECELVEEEDESTPTQCKLESADAAVSADLAHHRLHLALRYTAYSPTPVTITYWLRGNRGPLNLEPQHKRFGHSGVFRASQALTPAQAKKVGAARSFTIQIRPAGAPGYCREYLDQELSVRRGGPLWIDDESTFRRSRHA
jgi:hypothetical protein